MPTPIGLFDSFDNLDQLSLEAIAAWLKPVPQLDYLEDYLANRILYPQTIPQTERDMQIDLAILREALKASSPKPGENPFLNVALRKLLIPAKLLNFVPDLASLTWAFIDAFFLDHQRKEWVEDLWTIVLMDDIDEVVGSVMLPHFDNTGGVMRVILMNKNYEIRKGNLMLIPCPRERCEIAYKLMAGKVLGKTENAIEVYGGKLGLVVDGRGA
ncbi:MAG: glutamate mutase L [Patescibacteria group bacterium]|nr:glutamate mutase L [Patescibacteria group bacterium]